MDFSKMTPDDLAQLVAGGRELRNVEFKGPCVPTEKGKLAKVVRAVMAMANTRGGGHVVVGIEETRDGLVVRGLSNEDLRAWKPDHVGDAFASFADPPVDFVLEQVSLNGQTCVAISVREFVDLPVLCKRDGDGVRNGACYVRSRRKPESVEVPSHVEMRELIELAVEKNFKHLIGRIDRSGASLEARTYTNEVKSPGTNPAEAGAAVQTGPISTSTGSSANLKVVAVAVRGNERVPVDEIVAAIGIQAGQEVTRAVVMESLQRIYALGYFLNITAATEPASGGDRLVFSVIENPVLHSVELTGATLFRVDEIIMPFESMKGRIINLKDVQAAIRDIEKRYADHSFVLARVINLEVQPQGKLEIELAEGVIHAIKITGNEHTLDYLIRRELTLKPGMLYNFKRMEEDLRRVNKLNIFEDISIKYEPAPNAPGETVVIVNVKERPWYRRVLSTLAANDFRR